MMEQNRKKNVIFSIKGIELLEEEKEFFKKANPLGLILFSRNIEDESQLKSLCDDIRDCLGDNALILIDQEGGRVRRVKFGVGEDMRAPGDLVKFASDIGLRATKEVIYNQYRLCGLQLNKYGINVNCAPVADLYYDFADKIIGDRSFGNDVNFVVDCCKIVNDALAQNNVQGIIKHMPGHGRALVDSHHELPIVIEDLKTLESTDFLAFKLLKDQKMAMTAHVVYTAIDPDNPITLSKKGIDYIRKELGFNGIIITDDLNMSALPYSPSENFKYAIEAGCDVGLYCHGNLEDMKEIAKNTSYLDDELQAKVDELNCFIDSTFDMIGEGSV